MVVRNASFEIAAFESDAKRQENRFVELEHGAGRFSLWRPITQGQFGKFTLDINKSNLATQIPVVDALLQKVMLSADEVAALAKAGEEDADGVAYKDRIKDGAIPVGPDFLWDAFEAGVLRDDEGNESVQPIFRMIGSVMRTATGFPTEPSSGSTSTPRTSGPRSTASSRRQGSTRSTSRRAASPA